LILKFYCTFCYKSCANQFNETRRAAGSNWGDHCGMVAQACKENGKSVVTHRTPSGLKEADWRKGLELYKKAHATDDPGAEL
jgi:hypothetical protein